MVKRILLALTVASMALNLSGCWNYRGLNELTIISGAAIDKEEGSNQYKITFEVVSVSGEIKKQGPKSQIIESVGNTFFDTARNAKKRTANKLYFGNMQLLVISEKIAEEENMEQIIDFFLRDSEIRETLNVVVSKEPSARDILLNPGPDNRIVSYEIFDIVDNDQEITLSTKKCQLYQIKGVLGAPGVSLVLPAFHVIKNNDMSVVEVDGIAVFKEGKLYGYLSPEDTKYYLFAIDGVKGGILTCGLDEKEGDDISLEIASNKTKVSYTKEGEDFAFVIKPVVSVYIGEIKTSLNLLKKEEVEKIAKTAEEKLAGEITRVIDEVRQEHASDIFGFGNLIYKTDPKQWNDVKDRWDEIFQTMQIKVEPEIKIINSALKSN